MTLRTHIAVMVLALSPGLASAFGSATTSARALQQDTVTQPEYAFPEKELGTSDLVVTTIQAQTRGRKDAGLGNSFANSYYFSADTRGTFSGGVHLPTGAQMVSWSLEACDTSGADGLLAAIYRVGPTPDDGFAVLSPLIDAGTSATPGCAWFTESLDSPTTVRNLGNTYGVEVNDSDSSSTTRFRALRVVWKRQVTPAPGSATFNDVPTLHTFFGSVEALAASGETGGCGGGNFCPNDVVTRGQMAAFLARALGLHWPN